MTALSLVPHNCHDVTVDGRRVLFHVPTTAMFDLDTVGGAVLDVFKEKRRVSEDDLREHLDGRFAPQDVVEALQDLIELDIVNDGRAPAPVAKLQIENYPLSTLVLNVNTGCNLGCSYCYKEDLAVPSAGLRMQFETARKSIELLLREGHSRDRINIVFFGGEPLTNLPLIKQVVEYTERRCTEVGKRADFSVTTNATLLKEETVDWLNEHRFGIAISMDGPRHLHDRHRLTVGGQGTYDVVAKKARMLVQRYTARPIGARVTLARGNTRVIAIHEHLTNDIGFYEVGFAPVTSADNASFNLTDEELHCVFEEMKALGRDYESAALRGENTGFSNLHQLMTDLHEGNRKALPCGAGIGMLAVDNEGDLNLCHRFTGSELPTYGDVDQGIDKQRLGTFLSEAADRTGRGCATCRIRNLCAGGCYHESYARFDDPLHPVYHYCDIMRDWIDFGIGVYTRIAAGYPDFFQRHITPRRAIQ
ncbi:MAG: quinohemoprotein amine dehydrogenase maturation protein [Gammaproteobacteria bacterium]|nr:quinohemoprotein amine dehydrogenase maturation protein [Gammaproteobacteria bacterium]